VTRDPVPDAREVEGWDESRRTRAFLYGFRGPGIGGPIRTEVEASRSFRRLNERKAGVRSAGFGFDF
jgi:hypothetical protein